MRRMSLVMCVCWAALVAGCSDEESQRTKVLDPGPAAASKPAAAKAPLDAAIEAAIKGELKAQVAKVAAADPLWASYPTLTDDSRRSEMKDEAPPNQVHIYLRGLGVHVPWDTLTDIDLAILPERVELRLQYPDVSVELIDWSESKEAARIPDAWRVARPAIAEARWAELEREVATALGDGAPSGDAIKERLAQYRTGTARWEARFDEEFETRMGFMKGALWASNEILDRVDLAKAYMAARLMMSKASIVASIPGPAEVPIAPVLGGPIFGLQRGRGGVDREVHGAMSGADGVWLEVHMKSSDSKPIGQSEEFVNAFFDSMRPFEQRVSDAAAVMQKMKIAQKEKDPASRRKAALLALAAFHLDPRPKRAEALVECWARMEPRPAEDELSMLVEQVATWSKLGPAARKDLEGAIKETR